MKTLQTSLWAVVVLSMVAFISGCGDDSSEETSANNGAGDNGSSEAEEHDHGAGPHDGTLADWGGGAYHVEFTVDHDEQEATVYILGEDASTPAPIDAEEIQLSIQDPAMQVTLTAAPQESDPEGTASRFVGNHESLGVVQEYEGTISGMIDDTPYSGNFKEEPHPHDD